MLTSIQGIPFNNTYFFMRHGASEKNKLGIVTSNCEEYPLIDAGVVSAESVSRTILHECMLDYIYSSPVLRAKQSASIVHDLHVYAEVVYDDALNEYDYGTLDGRSVDEYLAFLNKRRSLGMEGLALKVPRGESLIEVQERIVNFFLSLNETYRHKNILLISHKEPLWMLQVARLGLTDAKEVWNTWGVETLSVGEFMKFV